jgi:hypothetical protein
VNLRLFLRLPAAGEFSAAAAVYGEETMPTLTINGMLAAARLRSMMEELWLLW